MYINDIHILIYIIAGIVGLAMGQFVNYCNLKLPKHEKIFNRDILKIIKYIEPNYIIIITNSIIYMFLVYKFGITNLEIIKFAALVPLLLSAFYIDSKLQIIPNRLSLTIFEIGMIFTFVQGISNLNIAIEMLLGMCLGAGMFLLITVLGGMFFGKETMGYGDVKMMGALGLFFGWRSIIAIAIISFFVGAIYSVILIINSKIKKGNKIEYIAFGPFIVISAFIVMFVPLDLLILIPFRLFTLGSYK